MVLSKPVDPVNRATSLIAHTDFSIWQSELTMMRTFWETQYHQNPDGLLRGKPLIIAEQWLKQSPDAIADRDRHFIEASLQAAQAELAKQRAYWENYVELACTCAEQRFATGEELIALDNLVELGQRCRDQPELNTPLSEMRVATTLQKMLNTIREFRHLETDQDLAKMVLSPDGKVLAAISRQSVLQLWHVSDGAVLASPASHQTKVNAVTFSPDSRLLAYTSEDSTLRLCPLGERPEGQTYALDRPDFDRLTFAPDGKTLAVSMYQDNKIHLCRSDQRDLLTLYNDTAIQNLCFSPDSQLLATSSYDHLVKLWSAKDGRKLAILSRAKAPTIAFSPDSQLLATTGDDYTIELWQLGLSFLAANTIKLGTLTGHLADITQLVFSPDGRFLASMSRDLTVKLWDVLGGTLKGTLVRLEDAHSCLQFSPDAQSLFAMSRWAPLKRWDLEHLDRGAQHPPCLEPRTLLLPKKGHRQIHFNEASTVQLLAQLRDRHIELWSLTKQPIQTLGEEKEKPTSLALSPDGQFIALGDRYRVIHIWHPDGTKVRTLEGHSREVRYVCFAADNNTLASVSTDNTLNIWKLDSRTELMTIKSHEGAINRIAFSPDGSTLASASDDGTVKLWHVNFSMLAAEGVELATLPIGQGVSCLGFAGKTLITGDYAGQLQFWDWEAGTLHHVVQAHDQGITHLALSPDGTQLVTSSYDHTMKRWSIEGQALATMRVHRARVDTVAWHPRGHILASASDDGTTKLLTIEGQEIATLHTCCCPKIISISPADSKNGVYLPQKSSKRSTHQHYRSHLTTLAFTPDGKTLVDTFSCGKTRFWNLDLAHLLSQGTTWLKGAGIKQHNHDAQ